MDSVITVAVRQSTVMDIFCTTSSGCISLITKTVGITRSFVRAISISIAVNSNKGPQRPSFLGAVVRFQGF